MRALWSVPLLCCLGGCALTNGYPPTDPEDTIARCENGVDDDLDGAIDCESVSCRALGVCIESEGDTCDNGLDDDGDALLDARDPGCFHRTPPALSRCASTFGTSLDSTSAGIQTIGLRGPLPYEPSLVAHEGRTLLTARGAGGRMFLLAPLTGALDGLSIRMDALLAEDDQLVANLVPASAVDASRGWDGFGALASLAIVERTYAANVTIQGGRMVNTALQRQPGVRSPRWHALSFHIDRPASGGHRATLEVSADGMTGPAVSVVSETDATLIEDEAFYLVLDLTPSPRFAGAVMQLDNLAISRPRYDPCGASVPSQEGPKSLAGVVRTPSGACVLGLETDGTRLGAYRLEGSRVIDTGERITLSGSRAGRVAMELDTEAGVIRAVASGHDGELSPVSILARLHTLHAAPDCTGWTEDRVDETPDGRRHASTTTALSGDVLTVAGILSSGRPGLETWNRTSTGWRAVGRGGSPAIPTESSDLLGYTFVALSVRGDELALVYTRPDDPGFWFSVRPSRSTAWTQPIPWQGPSQELGTFDATSIIHGGLLLDVGRVHYFYDTSYPVTSCTRCGVGFSRGTDLVSRPCVFGGCDAGMGVLDAASDASASPDAESLDAGGPDAGGPDAAGADAGEPGADAG